MIKKILVPVDGSEHAFKALDLACELAAKNEAGLILMHVVMARALPESLRRFAEMEHIEGPPEWVYEEVVGKNIVQTAAQRAKEHGLSALETLVRTGDPAKTIVETAAAQGIDAIVMGTRGLSDIRGLVTGSVAHKVNHLADCTVITVK